MGEAGIMRNHVKIESTAANAEASLTVHEPFRIRGSSSTTSPPTKPSSGIASSPTIAPKASKRA